jgi:fatty acid desaturase
MPYHTEHHTFPSVPFHRLPALHGDMARHLVHTAPSHAAFNHGLWTALAPRRTVAAG